MWLLVHVIDYSTAAVHGRLLVHRLTAAHMNAVITAAAT
jgi:hypothetical protein